ncbi:MAG TPA: hypothetical protein VMQ54_09965 [Steroidobacteraceae bacterium]|jgi:hypothetical protein|nr:hypothetical protein [Steroidobacteraceae bacterium]
MNSDELPRQGDTAPNELKQPWQQPVIDYLNLAASETGETSFYPPDGVTCSES